MLLRMTLIFKKINSIYLCVYLCVWMCNVSPLQLRWRSQDNLLELGSCLPPVGLGVVRLGGRHLYSLSHLAGPTLN